MIFDMCAHTLCTSDYGMEHNMVGVLWKLHLNFAYNLQLLVIYKLLNAITSMFSDAAPLLKEIYTIYIEARNISLYSENIGWAGLGLV